MNVVAVTFFFHHSLFFLSFFFWLKARTRHVSHQRWLFLASFVLSLFSSFFLNITSLIFTDIPGSYVLFLRSLFSLSIRYFLFFWESSLSLHVVFSSCAGCSLLSTHSCRSPIWDVWLPLCSFDFFSFCCILFLFEFLQTWSWILDFWAVNTAIEERILKFSCLFSCDDIRISSLSLSLFHFEEIL